MYNFTIPEKIVHRMKGYMMPAYVRYYSKRLENTDFTIISNNCWGGVIYDWFGLEKQSPTIGSYFFADEYLKFLKDLKKYLAMDLQVVPAEESRHADILFRKGQEVPVGVLGDVEIVFLHYKDPIIAKEKWNRRLERINWDNLIYKFSYMNGCNDALLEEFESIQGVKKICFVNKVFPQYPDTVVMPYLDGDGQVGDDTFYWHRNFDIIGFLNTPLESMGDYWKRQMKRNG